jgi:hypothetical protein
MNYKIGDKPTLKSNGQQVEIIAIIDRPYAPYVIKRKSMGGLDCVDMVADSYFLPPPPTVVFESIQTVYTHHYPRAGNSTGWETIKIQKRSDGTWHIEKV